MALRLRAAAAFLATVASLAACTTRVSTQGVVRVTITLASGTTARCVLLSATPATGTPRSTQPMVVGQQTELMVGVYQGDMQGPIALLATGFLDEACTTPTSPAETGTASATFVPAKIVDIAIPLARATLDVDGDGFSPPADCDDTDPTVHPGALERCTDHRDNDCNGLTDCADPACNALGCTGDGGVSEARCAAGVCGETDCADGLDNDGNLLADCADPSCDLRACRNQGLCQNLACDAGSEIGLCNDGVDNDHDGFTDCADSDCGGSSCSPDLCRPGDLCSGGQCVPAAPMSCTSPSNLQCQTDAGSCSGGVCHYPVLDAGCVDGQACTVLDRCSADGTACAGSPKVCDSPPFAPGCAAATMPLCNEADGGSCDYQVDLGGTCSDGQACTVSDHCLSDGGCAGTVSCSTPPPGECFGAAGSCDLTGACSYPVTVGAPCGAGLGNCDSAGVCRAPFPYPTSNFSPAAVMDLVDGGVSFAPTCDDTTIVTTGALSISGSGGNCVGLVLPPNRVLTPAGGVEVVVFAVDSFTLAGGKNLHLTGARPVIWAVFGDAVLAGTITVDAGADSFGCSPAISGTTDVADSNRTGGGGGGGYGLDGGNGGTPPAPFTGVTGQGGAASGNASIIPLRGGCRGADGGSVYGSGPGGSAGGGLQLSVAGSLSMSGSITAPGQGGTGGFNNNDFGGGGAGSGGAILVEASTLTFSAGATLAANGGSGGEGFAGSINGANGVAGPADAGRATTTGLSMSAGGDPGLGGSLAGPATAGVGGPDVGSGRGGGGGGGAVGRIRLNAKDACNSGAAGVVMSPAHTSGGATACP